MKMEILNQKFYEQPMGEKLFDSYERGGKWEYTVPDTFGFNLLKMVCTLGGKSKNNRFGFIPTIGKHSVTVE